MRMRNYGYEQYFPALLIIPHLVYPTYSIRLCVSKSGVVCSHHLRNPPMDDAALLKLLEAGIGEEVAAIQLNISPQQVKGRIKEYLQAGILNCNGERETINWKAFGKWKKLAQTVETAH